MTDLSLFCDLHVKHTGSYVNCSQATRDETATRTLHLRITYFTYSLFTFFDPVT